MYSYFPKVIILTQTKFILALRANTYFCQNPLHFFLYIVRFISKINGSVCVGGGGVKHQKSFFTPMHL